MTHTARHGSAVHPADTARHWLTAVLAIVGIVAGVLGTWLAYGPGDGALQVMGWRWNVADIADPWGPWLMISGGLLAAIGMGWETLRATYRTNPWVRGLEALVLVAGLTTAALGVLLLF